MSIISPPPTDPAGIDAFLRIVHIPKNQYDTKPAEFKQAYDAHYENMRTYPKEYGLFLFDVLAPNVDDKTEWNTRDEYVKSRTRNETYLYWLLINPKMQEIIFANPNEFAGLMNAVSLSIKYNGKFKEDSFAGQYGTLEVIRRWLSTQDAALVALQRLCLEPYRPIDLCQSKSEPESEYEPTADDAPPPLPAPGGEGESNTLMWILLFVFIVIVAIVGGLVWYKMRATGGQDILNEEY